MRQVIAGGLVAAAMTMGMGAAAASAQARSSEIGVSVRDLTADEVAKAKLPQAGGVLVEDVRDGSAASRAGLRDGDLIVEFDGERVRSASHLTRLVRESVPGRAVKLH